MKVEIDSSKLLKIMARHKARTLTNLEEIDCPSGYLTIVKNSFDYLKHDLVDLASSGRKRG